MSSAISQKEYLKRYLTSDDKLEKKKKKKSKDKKKDKILGKTQVKLFCSETILNETNELSRIFLALK
jgi:hypothetical protein